MPDSPSDLAGRLAPGTADAVDRLNRLAVSPAEAAQMTGLSRATIYNLIERGELRRSKIGRSTRIPVADLLTLIQNGIAQ